MTTKPKLTRSEVARLGGLATAKKGPDHYRAIGTKGAAATNARHAHKKVEWGVAGFQTRLRTRWDGDICAFGNWLSAKGLAATDPAPWNGAFPDPGPEPVALDELLDRDFLDLTR